MNSEPVVKRTIAFIDGQNLFHTTREAFGYTYPNYDAQALAGAVCRAQGWSLVNVHFYTGIPDESDSVFWHHFWARKLAMMGKQGVTVFSRPLRYRNVKVRLPDGTFHTFLSGEEKGVDVRLALDVIRLAHAGAYDVALIFSQDRIFPKLQPRSVISHENSLDGSRSRRPSPAALLVAIAARSTRPTGFPLTVLCTIRVWTRATTARHGFRRKAGPPFGVNPGTLLAPWLPRIDGRTRDDWSLSRCLEALLTKASRTTRD